jgi:AhpD family alkylhydroperoxidase
MESDMMHARMPHPVTILPQAMAALQAFGAAAETGDLPAKTIELVQLRASQINGCSACVDMHPRMMRRHGESEERIIAVAAWRHTPYFDPAERAALALAEALTRAADQGDAVPDALWVEVREHYDERATAALIVAIAAINAWNRLNLAVGQVAGEWKA